MANCPNCGNKAGEGAVFCDQCGARLPTPETAAPDAAPSPAGGSVICTACGAGNVPGEAFCDFCGSPLESPMPDAVTGTSAEVVEAVAPEGEPVSEEGPVLSEAEGPVLSEAEGPVLSEAEGEPTCPACGAKVLAGEAFCADCGASLALPPIPPEPVPEVEVPVTEEEVPEPAAAEAPPEPVVQEAPPAPPAPAPEAPSSCPACGAEVTEGDAFCSSCGAVLEKAPTPAPVEEGVPPPPPQPVGPRLVVVASGAEIPLPVAEEILIGREDPVSGVYPDIDLTPHGGEGGGVSRRHARLIVEGGDYFVEDLDSTNFTFVNKQKLTPKTRQPLNEGDEIRCGRVALVLKIG